VEREHEMTPHCLTSQCVPCTIQVLVINLWEECYGVCVKSLAMPQHKPLASFFLSNNIDNCVFCHLAGVIYTVIVLILYIQGAASMVRQSGGALLLLWPFRTSMSGCSCDTEYKERGREGFNSTDSDLPREIRLWVLTDLSCV